MADKAWKAQSDSLVEVQVKGAGLERKVLGILGWSGGRVTYDLTRGYSLQVDAAYPSVTRPEVIVSVTYTNPDKRGHSNENKLQLKIGELALLKGAFPEIRIVLAIGGSGEAWLSYVLKAFDVFFDEILFLWREKDRKRLHQIGVDPGSVVRKHHGFWSAFHNEVVSRPLAPTGTAPPRCSVRYDVVDQFKKQPIVHNPSLINNPIAQLCMRRSFNLNGAEWKSYVEGRWNSIEMSRNYFNPLEATVELTLSAANLKFEGGLARDIQVPSVLHALGFTETSLSEDFVLHSEALKQPVYIQCKASGGGRTQHGKNIQNRTKEQLARGIFYCASSPDALTLHWNRKHFHWISVLDGDWGVTQREPLKYVHMLQMAGYDKLICAADLLTSDLAPKLQNNPLAEYLTQTLRCSANRT